MMRTRTFRLLIVGLVWGLCLQNPAKATNLTYAVSFNGADQYARLGTAPEQLRWIEVMTGEAWFKTATAKDQVLIGHYARSTRDAGWYFGLRADGETTRLLWQARQSVKVHEFTLPERYDDAQWHHLAFSADGEKVKVFFDGQLLGMQVSEGRLIPPSGHFAIGALSYNNNWHFNGQMAEIRIWRGARSADQIAANYNRRLFGNEAGLVAYWPLNEGSGTTVSDQASGFDALLYNETAWVAADLPLSTLVLADPVTADRDYLHGHEAAVVRFPTPLSHTHYAFTQTDNAPTNGWTSNNTPPSSITFTPPGTPGPITLYAWFTNNTIASPLYRDSYTFDYLQEAQITALSEDGGAVISSPDEWDDIHTLGTPLTLNANADAGYQFLYWQGHLPPGTYPTNNPLNFLVDRERSLIAVFTPDTAPVRIWNGLGMNDLASSPENWQNNTPPQTNDSVYFGFIPEGGRTDCTWDLDVAVSNWTQSAEFSGVIDFQTVYEGAGTFTNLAINGDVVLEGGRWTHPVNADLPHHRLATTVAGSLVLGADAMIDLMGRGFGQYKGPAAGIGGARIGRAASHAGLGAYKNTVLPSACYGDPVEARTLGSGATQPGGGVMDVAVGGTAILNGLVSAEGEHRNGGDHDVYSGSAGGSIRLQAASIEGTGRITARGSIGYYAGAGGRIALHATDSQSISTNLKVSVAAGAQAWGARSTSGSCYLKTTRGEKLVFDGYNLAIQAGLNTELPAGDAAYPVHPAVGGPMEYSALILTNGAKVKLTRSLRLADFEWIDASSTLDLNGYTLYLKAAEPTGTFPDDYGKGTIVSNGGDIIWGDQTAEFALISSAGTHGSVSCVPDSTNDMYDVDTAVTITAIPASGNQFLWWTGELPTGVSRTANPLNLVMTKRYELRALFVTNDVNVRTWTGDGEDELASTAQNWHPTNTPVSGNHILFNAVSDKRCEWDLDIQPASWRQTIDYESFWSVADGYRGWVDFMIRYPGHGSFTNLTIAGDVELQGGTWSHDFNEAGDVESDRIWITIEGDFNLGEQAEINMNRRAGSGGYDVLSRGFAKMHGPSPGSGGARETVLYSASYGGRGGYRSDQAPQPCYGSFSAPANHGSGDYRGGGGGSIRLEVAGMTAINGLIDVGTDSDDRHSGGAGGSIWLTTGALSGTGSLHAYAGRGYYGGGGGRIAVILTESEDFADLDLRAWGGCNRGGEAGTIYLRDAAGRQRLIVDNNGYTGDPLVNYTELYDDGMTDFRDVELIIRNGGRVGIDLSKARIKNLSLDATSTLYLLGSHLVVGSPAPGETMPGTIVPGGGSLTWTPYGTVIMIR